MARRPGTVAAQRVRWLRWRIWLRRFVPTLIGMVLFGLLLFWSLRAALRGDWSTMRPRQAIDGMILWFCLGPVIIGLLRGWRHTLRRRSMPYPRWTR